QVAPKLLRRLLLDRWFSRMILRYERRTLESIECEVLTLADVVTLVSPADARCLLHLQQNNSIKGRAQITIVPPPVDIIYPSRSPSLPIRFVFVGSDKLVQNRLTIEFLIDLWRSSRAMCELHIFGAQTQKYVLPAAVRMRGFVENLSDIYDSHSVLLAPS